MQFTAHLPPPAFSPLVQVQLQVRSRKNVTTYLYAST